MSSNPLYSTADYQAALAALLPRGKAWSTDPASVQLTALGGFSPSFEDSDLAAQQLLVDAFPSTAVDLLPEWEETLGLPDPCSGELPTIQERQAQVVARFTNPGGQSVPFFVALLALLGYPVTITEYTGASAHRWTVNAPTVNVQYFRTGQSRAGEPLVSGGNAVLECIINALKPAHTTVDFNYV